MKRNGTIYSLIILACFAAGSYAVQTDIDCLRSIKESLEDPEQLLSSWNFSNNIEGFICRFTGVECWHPDESRVINIRLSDMGLRGPFPIGIRSCTSLSGLDLSSNILTGQLPSNVTDVLPFVTSLDLSNNDLSGSIPPSIANLSFINVLRLNNNQFTGQIPPELSKLHRLKVFSVANNRLSGEIPAFLNVSVSAERYANNLGLCGGPLSPCKHENHVDLFFSGFAVGLPVSTILTVLLIFCCLPEPTIRRYYLLMIKKIKEREHHLVPRVLQAVVAIENNIEQSKVKSSPCTEFFGELV
ncbi:hypothetical protein E3N88_07549 [Mikania micrantha]|uniref:Leucine-rich repeat-containing N-terminal plant-type domain-containing protein n=1 Tax=Mikania micrantha TaxID=192012 RepID=A0A5N6PRT9_9ASTR|nr:hypothetical protein E3N88_07549 [Mikania micrantha]